MHYFSGIHICAGVDYNFFFKMYKDTQFLNQCQVKYNLITLDFNIIILYIYISNLREKEMKKYLTIAFKILVLVSLAFLFNQLPRINNVKLLIELSTLWNLAMYSAGVSVMISRMLEEQKKQIIKEKV